MTKKKTPRGNGYTVRVGGRKYLTASLLEEQVEAAQQQLKELTQQNELLRSKEAKHLEALETVEAVLHTLGAVVEQPAPGTKQHAKWLEAVLLDMQALTLKQALQPDPAAAAQQEPLAPKPGPVEPSTQAVSEATCSRSTSSSMHTTGSEASSGMSVGGSTTSSGGGGGDNPHSSSRHRVTRLLASLTPEEIMQCKGLTMEELAARFKAGKDRMAQARAASLAAGPGDTRDLDRTVTEFGRLCMLSLMSDESRHCRVIGMNMETLQPETMSEANYHTVVESTQLQPEQVQQLCLAYRMFRKVEGELVQQQQEIMQQLQEILGPGLPQDLVASMLSPETAAGALPSADVAASAAAAAAAGRHQVKSEPGQHTLPLAAAGVKVQATDAAAAAAGGPAGQLSPQLQHLLKLRAKAAARAAAAAGAAARAAPESKAKQGCGPAAASSSAQGGASDGGLSAGALASMPRNSNSSGSTRGRAGNSNGSSSTQQGLLPGGVLSGQLLSNPSSGGISSSTPEHSALSTPGSSSSMQTHELLSGGVLGVEASEKVEALLESLLYVGWGLKHNSRNLASMGINLFSSEQYADSIIAAWPYFISPQCFCAVVAQANPGL